LESTRLFVLSLGAQQQTHVKRFTHGTPHKPKQAATRQPHKQSNNTTLTELDVVSSRRSRRGGHRAGGAASCGAGKSRGKAGRRAATADAAAIYRR